MCRSPAAPRLARRLCGSGRPTDAPSLDVLQVNFPDFRRVDWFNTVMAQLYPYAAKYGQTWVSGFRDALIRRPLGRPNALPARLSAACVCNQHMLTAGMANYALLLPSSFFSQIEDNVPQMLEENKPSWMRSIKLSHVRRVGPGLEAAGQGAVAAPTLCLLACPPCTAAWGP